MSESQGYPTTYSAHFVFPNNIETPRSQKYGNCWAKALASLMGDKLCIKYNLSPVIPSSIWITSMASLIVKKTFLNLDQTDIGFYEYETAEFIKKDYDENKFNSKLYSKLEDCYPENETFEFLAEEYNYFYGKEPKNIKQLDLSYFGRLFPEDCCLKNILGSEDEGSYGCKTVYDSDFDFKSANDSDGKIFITNLYKYNLQHFGKEEHNYRTIKAYQRVLKKFIYCNNLAVTVMNATDQYLRERYEDKIFEQTEEITKIGLHAVVILGYDYDEISERQFWYIRDTNTYHISKVAFSREDNKDFWIGIDILLHESHAIFSIDCDVENLDYMLKLGLFKRAESL